MLIKSKLIGIAVGDVNQAIYGFNKRFPKYLIDLIGREDFSHYELSKNHRCHPSVSEYSLCLYGAAKSIPEDKRVFQVKVLGNESSIAEKIDQNLDAIKKKYGIENNNQIAILCRNNSTVKKMDEHFQTAHKVFTDTLLDKDNSKWGRFFREVLFAYFDANIYAVDFAEQLFSETYESEKYRKALSLCNMIFSCKQNDIILIEDAIKDLARLVYPKKEKSGSTVLLHQVLSNPEQLASFVPASENEVNIMTIHKSKGLEFNIAFHMDLYKYILPNEYGNDEAQLQDLNLHYVGVTRAIDACYIMEGTSRYRAKYGDYIQSKPSPFLFISGLDERRLNVFW